MYGPTETTVFATWALVPPGAPEPPERGLTHGTDLRDPLRRSVTLD